MNNPMLVVTAEINPDELGDAQGYLSEALPMLVSGGGKILGRARVVEPVVGEATFGAALMMEFPSKESIHAVFDSEAYAKIKPLRDSGFRFMNIVIAEAQ